MVTYSIAFGVEGTVTSMPPNTTDPFAWPAPTTDPAKIDDLRHAAWNGRGDFFSAQNPAQLIGGLRGALQSIQGRIGSSASVAFSPCLINIALIAEAAPSRPNQDSMPSATSSLD